MAVDWRVAGLRGFDESLALTSELATLPVQPNNLKLQARSVHCSLEKVLRSAVLANEIAFPGRVLYRADSRFPRTGEANERLHGGPRLSGRSTPDLIFSTCTVGA